MPRILITGGEGVLGSSLSNLFLKMGNEITVVDIVRKDECWRLHEFGIMEEVDYVWKASQDINQQLLQNVELVIDCAIGFPDRPFGTSSPRSAIQGNLGPAIGMLEALRECHRRPLVIYPSSFNSLYGNTGSYSELTPVSPTSIYGWTKSTVEQLYRTYSRSFDVPILITRVGSSYGEMMRTDELVARLILSGIEDKNFQMKSPKSKRLWTYIGDVVDAYKAIVEKSDYGRNHEFMESLQEKDMTLSIAGNLNDDILDNIQLGQLIAEIMGIEIDLGESQEYEPGELVNGNPIEFGIDAEWSRQMLEWSPEYSLRYGLNETVKWFNKNHKKVGVWNQ